MLAQLRVPFEMGDLTAWLITLHVLAAILLLGPTGAFAVLGKRASDPATGGHKMLEALLEIQTKLVWPGFVVQAITGVWLLVRLDYSDDFFAHGWLWVSILAFAIIVVLTASVDTPAIKRIVAAGSAGRPPDPKDIKTSKTLGPIFGILFLGIAFLMMMKPF